MPRRSVIEDEPKPERDRSGAAARFTIPLDPTGGIDLEMMREGRADQLRELLNKTPGFRLDADRPASAPTIDPSFELSVGPIIDTLLDMLGRSFQARALQGGCAADVAASLRYTADEKEAIRKPALKVLHKYGLWSSQYADELALTLSFAVITGQKIVTLQAVTAPIDTTSAAPVSDERPAPRP